MLNQFLLIAGGTTAAMLALAGVLHLIPMLGPGGRRVSDALCRAPLLDVIITYYTDKSFTMEIKTPPASFYLKKAAGLKSASKTPGKGAGAGSVTMAQLREIAEAKMKDLNANDVEAAMQIIAGSARSMGIDVKG